MVYDSILLGEYLISYVQGEGYYVNQTKVQKLLYILYGSYLALYGERIIEEQPQAWPYGPVFPLSQKRFTNFDFKTDFPDINDGRFSIINNDDDLKKLLEEIIDTFGNWSAESLSKWTHQEDSPWTKALSKNAMKFGVKIDDDDIIEYFNSIMLNGDVC